jgi:hypothetical protein
MDDRMEFKPLPVPYLGYGEGYLSKNEARYFRVLHSRTQMNPENFVAEEVEWNTVRAKNEGEAKRRIKNTYKHHVLKVVEIDDTKELEEIKQKLYEKKAEEVV